jgi:hypothetical protein
VTLKFPRFHIALNGVDRQKGTVLAGIAQLECAPPLLTDDKGSGTNQSTLPRLLVRPGCGYPEFPLRLGRAGPGATPLYSL